MKFTTQIFALLNFIGRKRYVMKCVTLYETRWRNVTKGPFINDVTLWRGGVYPFLATRDRRACRHSWMILKGLLYKIRLRIFTATITKPFLLEFQVGLKWFKDLHIDQIREGTFCISIVLLISVTLTGFQQLSWQFVPKFFFFFFFF